MDRGAWQATVHGVAKGRTLLKPLRTQRNHPGWEGMPRLDPWAHPPPTARRWEELLHLLSQWLADGRGKRGPQRRGSVCPPTGGRLARSLPALVHLKGVGKE